MTYAQRQAFLQKSHVGKLFGVAHLFPASDGKPTILSISEKTFTKNVLESPIPVLVIFTAPWCGLCKIIHPLLLQFQVQCSDRIKLVEINAEQNFKLSNTYRLKSLPTLLLIENGIVKQRLEEFRSREDLRLALESIQIGYNNSYSGKIDNLKFTG
ncbi:thioredoxin family protein [Anabaena lutea]|uniref:thioredoxin family protein n=1 Tax=Anabaena lutea TaxID=212350 RepID=UPI0018F0260B|nr:thioredoxin family protein [Anabaena lutea]